MRQHVEEVVDFIRSDWIRVYRSIAPDRSDGRVAHHYIGPRADAGINGCIAEPRSRFPTVSPACRRTYNGVMGNAATIDGIVGAYFLCGNAGRFNGTNIIP